MRTVGIETDKRYLIVYHVLSQYARNHRFAYAAFLAADKMNSAHCFSIKLKF